VAVKRIHKTAVGGFVAAVKLPKCLEGPHITCDKSTNSSFMNSFDSH